MLNITSNKNEVRLQKFMADCSVASRRKSEELIEAAYEEMMKNLPAPKMSYENKILKNWHDAGVKTVAEAKEKGLIGAAKPGKSDNGPSFDLGEFFELAVQRGKAESENK